MADAVHSFVHDFIYWCGTILQNVEFMLLCCVSFHQPVCQLLAHIIARHTSVLCLSVPYSILPVFCCYRLQVIFACIYKLAFVPRLKVLEHFCCRFLQAVMHITLSNVLIFAIWAIFVFFDI